MKYLILQLLVSLSSYSYASELMPTTYTSPSYTKQPAEYYYRGRLDELNESTYSANLAGVSYYQVGQSLLKLSRISTSNAMQYSNPRFRNWQPNVTFILVPPQDIIDLKKRTNFQAGADVGVTFGCNFSDYGANYLPMITYGQYQNFIRCRIKSVKGYPGSDGIYKFRLNFFLSTKVFNPSYYKALNSDLSNMNDGQLMDHWISNGVVEGRRAHKNFSIVGFINRNSEMIGFKNKPWFYPLVILYYIVWGYPNGKSALP